jgi:hypothetical protein
MDVSLRSRQDIAFTASILLYMGKLNKENHYRNYTIASIPTTKTNTFSHRIFQWWLQNELKA